MKKKEPLDVIFGVFLGACVITMLMLSAYMIIEIISKLTT